VRPEDQKTKGSVLARNLCRVIKKVGATSTAGVDDTALGPIKDDKPTNYVIVATFPTPLGQREIWFRRFKDKATSRDLWLVTRRTVSEIEGWHQMLVKKRKLTRQPVKVLNEALGPIPADYRLRTPRDAATLFTKKISEGSFEDAARLLDLSKLGRQQQKQRGPRLARRLGMILKRLHPGSFSRISNDPMGSPETGVPFDEEVLAGTDLGKSKVQVRLALQPRESGDAIWIFPEATVADIDTLYETLGYGWAGDYLPPVFFEVRVWKIQLWQWLGLLVALFLGYIIGVIVSFLLRKLLLRLARLTSWEWDDEVVDQMRGPLTGAGWALGFVILTTFLALADKPRATILGLSKLVAILALGWFVMRLVDVAARQLMAVFKARGDDMGVAMIPVTRKILKPILFVIILIVALQNIGVDVSGLLAGLGIGGLAFALAAKDTLANVFGSVAIAFDRPFKVGEFVKIGDLLGTVEDVGLRTTRLRTLDRTVIAIPNSQVADSKIENYAFRDRVRLLTTFGVQYDTSQEQIRYIIDEMKRYLLQSDHVYQDGWRVRFAGYGGSSQDIEVLCYLATDDFNAFTAMREEVLLDLGKIVTDAGAEFAFPSQTVYVGKDSHADAKKAKAAAAKLT